MVNWSVWCTPHELKKICLHVDTRNVTCNLVIIKLHDMQRISVKQTSKESASNIGHICFKGRCCLKATLHSCAWICVSPPNLGPQTFFFTIHSFFFFFVFTIPLQFLSTTQTSATVSLYETANPSRVITKASTLVFIGKDFSSEVSPEKSPSRTPKTCCSIRLLLKLVERRLAGSRRKCLVCLVLTRQVGQQGNAAHLGEKGWWKFTYTHVVVQRCPNFNFKMTSRAMLTTALATVLMQCQATL